MVISCKVQSYVAFCVEQILRRVSDVTACVCSDFLSVGSEQVLLLRQDQGCDESAVEKFLLTDCSRYNFDRLSDKTVSTNIILTSCLI